MDLRRTEKLSFKTAVNKYSDEELCASTSPVCEELLSVSQAYVLKKEPQWQNTFTYGSIGLTSVLFLW